MDLMPRPLAFPPGQLTGLSELPARESPKREELVATNSMLLHELYFGSLGGDGQTMAPALDMYEHSYHMDFGAAAGACVDALMVNIDWARVYERYQLAVHGASEPFGASQDELSGAELLDVRRAGMFEQAKALIPGARWHDPAGVDE